MSLPKLSAPWRRSTDKPRYDSVATGENIPLEDEQHSPADEITDLRHSLHKLRLWLITISVVSGLAFLIVGGAKYSHKLPTSLQWHASPIPQIPMVPKTLDQDDRYAVVSSPESNHLWHSLIPKPGTGFVEIQDPRKYPDLKPGMPAEGGKETYGVSIFHQLHCLIHIRHHLWSLDAAAKTHNTSAIAKLEVGNGHINHCLDFLRQALMCNADLTLEWPRSVEEEGGGTHAIVDGNHVPHQCKDWGTIFDWAGKNAHAQDGPI